MLDLLPRFDRRPVRDFAACANLRACSALPAALQVCLWQGRHSPAAAALPAPSHLHHAQNTAVSPLHNFTSQRARERVALAFITFDPAMTTALGVR